jgi:hypothetical protein
MKAQWQQIIQHESSGTIFVFKAEANIVDEESTVIFQNVKKWNGSKPLIAIGTHQDFVTRQPSMWSQVAQDRLGELLFRSHSQRHIYITSPPLYISASYALRYLGLRADADVRYEDIINTPARMVRCLLQEICNLDLTTGQALESQYGTKLPRATKDWAKETPEQRVKCMNAELKDSKGIETIEAIKHVLVPGVLAYRAYVAAKELRKRLHDAQKNYQ